MMKKNEKKKTKESRNQKMFKPQKCVKQNENFGLKFQIFFLVQKKLKNVNIRIRGL